MLQKSIVGRIRTLFVAKGLKGAGEGSGDVLLAPPTTKPIIINAMPPVPETCASLMSASISHPPSLADIYKGRTPPVSACTLTLVEEENSDGEYFTRPSDQRDYSPGFSSASDYMSDPLPVRGSTFDPSGSLIYPSEAVSDFADTTVYLSESYTSSSGSSSLYTTLTYQTAASPPKLRNSTLCTSSILSQGFSGIQVAGADVVELISESAALGIQCLRQGAKGFVATDLPAETSALSMLKSSFAHDLPIVMQTPPIPVPRLLMIRDVHSVRSQTLAQDSAYRALNSINHRSGSLSKSQSKMQGDKEGKKERVVTSPPSLAWMVIGHALGEQQSLDKMLRFRPGKYDLIISNDVLWAEESHASLLLSIQHLIKPNSGRVLIVCGTQTSPYLIESFINAAHRNRFAVEAINRWSVTSAGEAKHMFRYSPYGRFIDAVERAQQESEYGSETVVSLILSLPTKYDGAQCLLYASA